MKNRMLQHLGMAVLLTACLAYADQESPKALAPSPGPPGAGAGAQNASGADPGSPTLQRRNARYQLRKGDILTLVFPFTPEFDQELTIQPDGYISLRGVGDLL